MQRLESTPPEEMSAVVRLATELQEQDRVAAQAGDEAQSAISAAEEVGLPREYVERAAALLQARRMERVKRKRAWTRGLIAAAVVGGLIGSLYRPASPPPAITYRLDNPALPWRLDVNAETHATMTQQVIDGRHAVLVHVDRFGNGAHAYWANVDSSFAVRSVAGYNSVSFGVKGSGLRTIRLYVENGPSERWRSPPVPVTLSWTESTVRLQDFDHQSRPGATDLWRIAGASRPDRVERFSFKLGSFVNEQSARGTVAIADLRLSTH